jgi:hypothetical protein
MYETMKIDFEEKKWSAFVFLSMTYMMTRSRNANPRSSIEKGNCSKYNDCEDLLKFGEKYQKIFNKNNANNNVRPECEILLNFKEKNSNTR